MAWLLDKKLLFLQRVVVREIRLLGETRQTKTPLAGLTVTLRVVVGKLLFSYSAVSLYRTGTGTQTGRFMARFIFITCLVADTHGKF